MYSFQTIKKACHDFLYPVFLSQDRNLSIDDLHRKIVRHGLIMQKLLQIGVKVKRFVFIVTNDVSNRSQIPEDSSWSRIDHSTFFLQVFHFKMILFSIFEASDESSSPGPRASVNLRHFLPPTDPPKVGHR